MSQTIHERSLSITSRKAFSIAEALIGTLISLYIIAGVWGVYEMTYRWWGQVSPLIEAQQIARLALLSVTDGSVDTSLGTDVISSQLYHRRNGLIWAKNITIPASSSTSIDFGLEADGASKPRSFRLGTDSATGLKIVQYKDSSGTWHDLRGTLGITDLQFAPVSGLSKAVKITATVVRAQPLGRPSVTVTYYDVVYLRNI